MICRYKIEIVDNQAHRYYAIALFEMKKAHWYSREKSWCFVYNHSVGYNYRNWRVKAQEDIMPNEIMETYGYMIKDHEGDFEIHKTTVTELQCSIHF